LEETLRMGILLDELLKKGEKPSKVGRSLSGEKPLRGGIC